MSSNTEYTFALVPKQTGNNPFFDVVAAGCKARAEQLGNVKCLYIGPETRDADGQANVILDLINGVHGKIDGISMSVIDTDTATDVIQQSLDAGIPIITFDSDAMGSSRIAYIGTDNFAFGQELGKVLDQLAPEGGNYGMITAGAPNVMERVAGVRDNLGDSNWKEVEYSPLNCQDSVDLALEQMYEFASDPNIDAIVPVGGWPMFNGEGWKNFVDANRDLRLVSGDTLPEQLDLMNKGYVDGLVGQLPFEMGAISMDTLLDIQKGNDPPKEIFGTAFLEVLRFPIVLPPLTVDENYIGSLAILGYILFAIIALGSLVTLGWTYYYRENRIVRASQPIFLGMVSLGVLVMSTAIIPMTIDDDKYSERAADIACMSKPWLLTIGFTTTFSALFVKTWRINKIFHNPSAYRRIKVTARDVIGPYLVLMFINVVTLTCWTVIAPLTYEGFNHRGTDDWNRVISTYGKCVSLTGNETPYLVVIGIANIGLLILANFQCYQARSIQSEFSESKYIAIIMASMLQACIIGVPIIILTIDEPRIFFVVLVFLLFVVCMSILCFMFIPKYFYFREYLAKKKEKRQRKEAQGNITSTPSEVTSVEESGLKVSIMLSHQVSEYVKMKSIKEIENEGFKENENESTHGSESFVSNSNTVLTARKSSKRRHSFPDG